MALTPGAKKLGITVIVAAAIACGGFYFTKYKKTTPTVEAPAQAQTVPVTSEPAPVAVPAPKAVSEVKKEQKVPAAKAKPRPVNKKANESSKRHNEPSHKSIERELTSDEKALKDMAGDKL